VKRDERCGGIRMELCMIGLCVIDLARPLLSRVCLLFRSRINCLVSINRIRTREKIFRFKGIPGRDLDITSDWLRAGQCKCTEGIRSNHSEHGFQWNCQAPQRLVLYAGFIFQKDGLSALPSSISLKGRWT
jgi:hypothetical protein